MGMCENCPYFKYEEDRYDMRVKCMKTSSKGKSITWSSFVYNAYYMPLTEENQNRKVKLQNWAKTHKEPFWCPKKKGE